MVVRVPFHARTLHILIMTDLFFATYDELILLTKSWKVHDVLIKIVVHNVILIEVASKIINMIDEWQTGHVLPSVPDTCPI